MSRESVLHSLPHARGPRQLGGHWRWRDPEKEVEERRV